MDLKQTFKSAAEQAYQDGVTAKEDSALAAWIKRNCENFGDNLALLIICIGSELADIEARHKGYASEVDRAVYEAKRKISWRHPHSQEARGGIKG